MTEKLSTDRDAPRSIPDQDALAEETKSPSLVERVAWQTEEETIQRALDEGRARRQLEDTLLGLGPDASLADRERARRELAETLGLEPGAPATPAPVPADEEAVPEPPSLVEQVAQRARRDAATRARAEYRLRRKWVEELGEAPGPTPEGPAETPEPPSLAEQGTERADQEAADRGDSEEHRLRQRLAAELEPKAESPQKGEDA